MAVKIACGRIEPRCPQNLGQPFSGPRRAHAHQVRRVMQSSQIGHRFLDLVDYGIAPLRQPAPFIQGAHVAFQSATPEQCRQSLPVPGELPTQRCFVPIQSSPGLDAPFDLNADAYPERRRQQARYEQYQEDGHASFGSGSRKHDGRKRQRGHGHAPYRQPLGESLVHKGPTRRRYLRGDLAERFLLIVNDSRQRPGLRCNPLRAAPILQPFGGRMHLPLLGLQPPKPGGRTRQFGFAVIGPLLQVS